MNCQIAIYSGDAVFARMLELEFLTRNMSVITLEQPSGDVFRRSLCWIWTAPRHPTPLLTDV